MSGVAIDANNDIVVIGSSGCDWCYTYPRDSFLNQLGQLNMMGLNATRVSAFGDSDVFVSSINGAAGMGSHNSVALTNHPADRHRQLAQVFWRAGSDS